jgi:hypothetical protein
MEVSLPTSPARSGGRQACRVSVVEFTPCEDGSIRHIGMTAMANGPISSVHDRVQEGAVLADIAAGDDVDHACTYVKARAAAVARWRGLIR